MIQPTYLQCSKMDNIINVGMRGEYAVESGFVRDINVEKLRLLSTDELNAVQDHCGRIIEIVYDDDLVASLQKCQGSEGTDIACATTAARQLILAWKVC